jgi:hypothetical protein
MSQSNPEKRQDVKLKRVLVKNVVENRKKVKLIATNTAHNRIM